MKFFLADMAKILGILLWLSSIIAGTYLAEVTLGFKVLALLWIPLSFFVGLFSLQKFYRILDIWTGRKQKQVKRESYLPVKKRYRSRW